MTTALQIITSAMRKIGAITKNETPSADEAEDGLQMLNDLLASLSMDSIKINARTLENFALTGAVSYTIGTGGNFNTTRPVDIVSAYLRQGTTDYPLKPSTDENFAAIPDKSTTGAARVYNYDNAYPLGTIKFHPVPDASYTLYILSEKPLTSFASLSTNIDLPPGVKRMLDYNLAIDMGPEYGQSVSAEVAEIASQARAAVSGAVMKNRSLDVPGYAGSVGTINNGFIY